MSVFGPVVTTLQLYGGPGRPIGKLYRRLVISLSFDLQVAGPDSTDFSTAAQSCQDANAGIQIIARVLGTEGDPINISAASDLVLRFQKPDGTTVGKVASFLTNGMDGAVYYTTAGADFDMDGEWQVQASFSISGESKTTRWSSFSVNPNIVVE